MWMVSLLLPVSLTHLLPLLDDEPEGVPPVPNHIPLDNLVASFEVLLLFLGLDLLQCGILPAVISANLKMVGLVMFNVSH